MSAESLAVEIGAVTRLALGFGQRHDVPVEELLSYQTRKAQLLTEIAVRRGGADEREVASAAWRRVRELQEQR